MSLIMGRPRDRHRLSRAFERHVSTFRTKLIAAGVLGSLLLAIIGPFNTYGQGHFGVRLIFWGGIVAFSLLLASVIKPWAQRRIPNNAVLREAVIIAIFLPVFLPALLFWIEAVFPPQTRVGTPVGVLLLYVLGICAIISAAIYLIPAMLARRSPMVPRAKPASVIPPRLIRRLPGAFSGKVLRLTGDGHFVKVTTTEGTYDIRMRLRDAVDEMDGVSGFWSHRSHWVATEAIQNWMMSKGRPQLILSNGDKVPVGAKYQPELEAAGFDFARGIETENV